MFVWRTKLGIFNNVSRLSADRGKGYSTFFLRFSKKFHSLVRFTAENVQIFNKV